MSHLRANQLQDFAATNNIKTRESLVRRWGRVGRSKDEVALNKDDDQLLEACLDEGNRQLFSLRSLEDVAIKALPAAKDSDDSVAHYRGRGLARVT